MLLGSLSDWWPSIGGLWVSHRENCSSDTRPSPTQSTDDHILFRVPQGGIEPVKKCISSLKPILSRLESPSRLNIANIIRASKSGEAPMLDRQETSSVNPASEILFSRAKPWKSELETNSIFIDTRLSHRVPKRIAVTTEHSRTQAGSQDIQELVSPEVIF